MKYKALIAVRSGSIRVKNKNMRPFAGSNLLTIKIEQLKRIPSLDGIVVNSNNDEMLNLAKSLGCEAIKRDSHYASNSISMSDVYRNMSECFTGDFVVYANVTNPLIKDTTIEKMIEEFKMNYKKNDSYNSAHLIKEFLFLNNKPINYQLDNQPRSQDLPNIAALNFAVNIISKDDMIEVKNVVGKNPFIYLIDELESTDIDNPIDFSFSEFAYQIKNTMY